MKVGFFASVSNLCYFKNLFYCIECRHPKWIFQSCFLHQINFKVGNTIFKSHFTLYLQLSLYLVCSLPLFYLVFSLQDRYSAIVVRISSRAGWTIYSLRRCHVLPHPLTSGKPKWTQVRNFREKMVKNKNFQAFLSTSPYYWVSQWLPSSPSTSQYLTVWK